MKVVIAPQSFKGNLPAIAVANAIARGVRSAAPEVDLVLAPVADGGDGTLEVLVGGTGGKFFEATVAGPLGIPVAAQWGVMGDGETAVIEMARASGLALLPRRKRDPRFTTSRGTGELIKEALDRGFRRVIVGLGGSATNDGGAAMAAALGVQFLDTVEKVLEDGGAALVKLARVDMFGLDPRLAETQIIGATDVTNPLCGPNGASTVYGPQKGASAREVSQLEAALTRLAEVVEYDLGYDVKDQPRTGAAGGLGAGLAAFAGAELRSGVDLVCEVLGFDQYLEGADLVITAEGRADGSTAYDKAPLGVARRALRRGVPTILLAGSLGSGYEGLYQHGMAGVMCIADRPMSFDDSLARTEELLEGAAGRAVRLVRVGIR